MKNQHFERTNDIRCGYCNRNIFEEMPTLTPGSHFSALRRCTCCYTTRFNFNGEPIKTLSQELTPQAAEDAVKQFIIEGKIDKVAMFKRLTPVRLKGKANGE